MSNFDAAMNVSNRSACLLYYYALLNFAKAELIDTHAAQIVDTRIYHGLTFDVTRARTIAGDRLRVNDGLFRILYERRVGRTIAVGQSLPVKRLFANVPEIGTQLNDAGLGQSAHSVCYHMIATDGASSWPILLLFSFGLRSSSTSGRLFFSNFREIQMTPNWRDHFGLSRRTTGGGRMFESIEVVPNPPAGAINVSAASEITWRLKDIVSLPIRQYCDAYIIPSLYATDWLPMPASLARYALMFYASSLVRYKPAMFDSQLFPEQAYLFDAIARECALPMFVDTLANLEGKAQIFQTDEGLRL